MTAVEVLTCVQCRREFVPRPPRWWCKMGVQNGNKPLEACSKDCLLEWVRDDQARNWKRR